MTDPTSDPRVDPLWGEPVDRAESVSLTRDGWSMTLAPHGIEDVELDGIALFPRIFFSVRNPDWSTPALPLHWDPPSPDGITFSGEVAGLSLTVRGRVAFTDDGLTLHFTARADEEVAVARIGPCVLHPASRAGTPVLLGDGRTESFSAEIRPTPAMSDSESMTFEAPGAGVELTLVGSTWETEDQRNWGDSTYKSYCPPLSLPRPMRLAAGAEQEWTVGIRATATLTRPAHGERREDAEIRLQPAAASAVVPALGLTHQGGPLPDAAVSALSRLPLDFLHLFADLDDDAWETRLLGDLRAAEQLSVRALVTIGCAPAYHERLLRLADLAAGRVDTVLVFDTGSAGTSALLASAAVAAMAGSGVTVGGGSRGHFSTINSAHGVPAELEVVSVPLAAGAHDDDRRALMSSPSSFAAILGQARALTRDRPLFIGPVGLVPTYNAWVAKEDPEGAARAWTAAHPRQPSVFAAAWHVSALAALTALGVDRVCIGGTLGGRGVGVIDDGEFIPYPVFAALEALNVFRGQPVTPVSDGERVAGLRSDVRTLLAVATDDIRSYPPGGLALRADATWSAFRSGRVPTPTVILDDA